MDSVKNDFKYPSQEAIQVGNTRLPKLKEKPLPTPDTFAASLKTALQQTSKGVGNKDRVPYDKLILTKAQQYGLSPSLLRSVIRAESDFQPRLVSSAGAMGLMQLMPETAKELGVDNPYDPEQNIDGGARYLRQLLDRYHGDTRLALAAYNAGPTNVARYGGVPPFSETRNYIDKIMGYLQESK